MTGDIPRRRFLGRSLAAAATIVAFDPVTRTWVREARADTIPIPSLDGMLVEAGPLLAEAADDFGHIISRMPVAVLIPGSIHDIKKLVKLARCHGLRVGGMSMIGNTHSSYGQSQVEAGVVIDMSALCEIHEINEHDALVDAGVRWEELLEATVPLGKSPPTLTDLIDLSVGGTLSVGGIGGQAFQHGLQVDNVLELQVVTGRGKVVTCSPTHRADLFESVRAGLGQFAIVVRARVRLVDVPPMVRTYTAVYADAATFTGDQVMLVQDGRFDYVEGSASPDGSGGWLYSLEAAKYFDPAAPPDDATQLAGLSFLPGTEATTDQSYFDFANRLAPLVAFLKSIGVWDLPHPWLNLFLPGSEAASFVASTLAATTEDDVGQGPVLIYPFLRAAATADFVPLPGEDVVFLFALLRNSLPFIPGHLSSQLQRNRELYDAAHALGGSLYAISSVDFDALDWQDHFGGVWDDFVAAKDEYDPDRILTPGQGIF
ncbi:MAG: FAD-binding protein [Myxococcales bacterium]|nr:FAD-binding protein [Myxococcales bacterium]MCB9716527.1 FAD-binding protein [Myxococcales bacterium]